LLFSRVSCALHYFAEFEDAKNDLGGHVGEGRHRGGRVEWLMGRSCRRSVETVERWSKGWDESRKVGK
jgi:hypothetical protein